jgi:UDP-N-acetyl-D-mannosaminuronic acid transferase (WecB/TagA/CpsF family)
MIDRGKHNLLGVKVDAVDYTAAVAKIIAAARASQPLAVSALAVHGVMTGVLDPAHRYRLNQFDLNWSAGASTCSTAPSWPTASTARA